MALAQGSRLGSYEVLSLIGAGGMGEVYRARDSRLGRDVAIKVLPAERLADEHRRQRFVREAQAASALNHPHIVTIHEIETAGDIDFIVMEYVRGRSLDAAIPRQGMRLGELLRVAIPVADALAAAHARNIIHRDLKPANVAVGDEGAVKVLDFGLAKLTDSDASSDDATMTAAVDPAASVPGVIVGTAAYMSPEQATGQAVDARSDIFSFGAVLYEMATGTRAFAAPSAAGTLTAVVRAQPRPPSEIVAALPRELERLILRCLRKEPERRYQTMLDVKLELQEIQEESESGKLAVATAPVTSRKRTGLIAIGLASVVVVALGTWLLWPKRSAEQLPVRVVPLTSLQGVEVHPTFSPDGDQVAFSYNATETDYAQIYVKFVGSTEERRLTSHESMHNFTAWSPDGRLIAFTRYQRGAPAGMIHTISPLGGVERKIFDCLSWRARWSPDSKWLIADCYATQPEDRGIYLVSPDGKETRRLTRAESPATHQFPDFSPDGRRVVYTSCIGQARCTVEVLDLTADLQPAGKPRQLRTEPFFITESTWTRDGSSVIYATEVVPFGFYLWRQAADGSRPPERIEVAGIGAIGIVAARTRDRLTFARINNAVSIHALGSTDTAPVLGSALWDYHPDFSHDGKQLAFSSSRSGESLEIWVAAADGSGAHQITRGPGIQQGSPSWSPDGTQIAFESNAGGAWNIWLIGTDGSGATQLTNDGGDHNLPTWSRDGKWVYYSSLRDGARNIWRVPAGGGGAPAQVTTGGSGFIAFESDDGRELLYNAAGTDSPLLAQPLSGGPPRQVLPCVPRINFFVGPTGIYFASCGPGPDRTLSMLDPRTGSTRALGKVRDVFRMPNRFAVSPDGKTILIHRPTFNADLMLLENYR